MNYSTPLPLKNINIPPPFPTNALPEVLKSYTDFISETAQVSPDMPAMAILAALSVCLQGKAKIRFSPYWFEELNLYFAYHRTAGRTQIRSVRQRYRTYTPFYIRVQRASHD